MDSGCEGGNDSQNENTEKKRALFLIDLINENNNLARETKNVRNYLRDNGNAEAW